MGSFLGHLLPGSLFVLVGLWHLCNCLINYVLHPKSFRGRVWHPARWAKGRGRYLELYVVMFGAFVDMCIELFYSTHMKFILNGELNPLHMNDFEHATMLLMFLIFYVTTFISETTGLLPLPDGALYFIAAMAFTAEYLLFFFHSTSHAGLEGRYHQILVVCIGLCILFAVLGGAFPTSFIADFVGGFVITLQGTWFYQTAYSLYGPLLPDGCHEEQTGIFCDSPDFEMRGQTLANFQFSLHIIGLFSVALLFYGVVAHLWGHPQLRDGSLSKHPAKAPTSEQLELSES